MSVTCKGDRDHDKVRGGGGGSKYGRQAGEGERTGGQAIGNASIKTAISALE